jgi:hypothetical protein
VQSAWAGPIAARKTATPHAAMRCMTHRNMDAR